MFTTAKTRSEAFAKRDYLAERGKRVTVAKLVDGWLVVWTSK